MTRSILIALAAALPALAQSGATNGEWRHYGADLGNTHYSSLDHITAANFDNHQVAWRYKT
jgi:quinoprotein glucose dehydrogenase